MFKFDNMIGFIGIILIVSYDRITIWFFYRYLNIKIHNGLIKFIVNTITLISGIVILLIVEIPDLINSELLVSFFDMGIIALVTIVLRWLTVKSNYLYFPLDEDFSKED